MDTRIYLRDVIDSILKRMYYRFKPLLIRS